jgi:Domain of unknown function (DUF4328)
MSQSPAKPKLIPFLDNRDRANWAIIAMVVETAILIFYLMSVRQTVGIFEDFEKGRSTFEQVENSATSMDMVGNIYIFLTLVNAIIFIMWFHRAYKNLATCGRPSLASWGPGWAIGGWFVPFLNLVRPVQIAQEIGQGMQKLALVRTKEDLVKVVALPLIGVWWGISIFHGLMLRIGTTVIGNATRPDDVVFGLNFLFYSFMIGIVATFLCIMMVRQISRFEAVAFERHNAEAAQYENPFSDQTVDGIPTETPETTGDPKVNEFD